MQAHEPPERPQNDFLFSEIWDVGLNQQHGAIRHKNFEDDPSTAPLGKPPALLGCKGMLAAECE